MDKEPLIIHLDPDSELARTLAYAENMPVVLETNGVRFRVIRDTAGLWADYDPEAALAGLRAVAGTMTSEEGERIKQLIYGSREEGTRPLSRRSRRLRAGQFDRAWNERTKAIASFSQAFADVPAEEAEAEVARIVAERRQHRAAKTERESK